MATITALAAPTPIAAPEPPTMVTLLNSLTNIEFVIKALAEKYNFDPTEARKLVFAAFAAQLQSDTPIDAQRAVATATGAVTADGKPKRTPAAFDLFAKEHRTTKREELPEGTKSAGVTAALRDDWRNLSDEEKLPFVNEAKRLREAAKPPVDPNSKKAKRATKDENAPKRPKNAYMLYAGEVRETVKAELEAARENPEMKIRMADISRKTGEKWNKLNAELKAPYEQQAALAKEKYTRAKEIYDEQKKSKTEAAAAPAPAERAVPAAPVAPVAAPVQTSA